VRREVDAVERDRAVDGDRARDGVGQRLAPDGEDGVRGENRVTQRPGLRRVELLCLLAVAGVAEVEVARHAQQRAGADRAARSEVAVGHVGLDRPEVAPAVEDDRQRGAGAQRSHLQRDRRGCAGVEERAAKQLLGLVPGVIRTTHAAEVWTMFRSAPSG
jgi:hypothetical protein